MTKHSKRWCIAKPSPVLQEIFVSKLGISRVIAQILLNRGITTLDEARMFLAADFGSLHSPFMLKDMDKAVERIRLAVQQGEKVRVFGDYDADGITSTCIMVRALRRAGVAADYYIPERLTEGYGLNEGAVTTARKDGISLIVTVDCGITAVREVELAGELGIDIIITDHHEPQAELPQALALINPKQRDCRYPFKDLAGAGVAFKLGQAVLGCPETGVIQELIELACLGTIADIVPLKGENRILVRYGLDFMSRAICPGLRALIRHSGITDREITSHQVAFQMAPRINAAGRLGEASTGVRLLLSEDAAEAEKLALELCIRNDQRQALEAAIYKDALREIEAGEFNPEREKVLVLAKEGWHLGVIGIVASRLAKDFYRPVVLLGIEGDDAKGSARSIPPFDIFTAFQHCEKHLAKYGGHRQAAGLTIPVSEIGEFMSAINRYAEEALSGHDLLPEVNIDSEVRLKDLDDTLYHQLQMLAPYGCDNQEPLLAAREACVLEHRTVGVNGAHLKFRVGDGRSVYDGIGFNFSTRSDLFGRGEMLDVVFTLEKNEWNGKTRMQLNLKDFRPSIPVKEAGSPAADAPGGFAEEQGGFVEELFRNAVTYLTDDIYRDIAAREEFYTKVAGVTFEGRQAVVAGLTEGETLQLLREPDNRHDSNAVRVETASGSQAGYLNARLARHFAPLLDRGEQYVACVTQVTGGSDRNFGVNIIIRKAGEEDREDNLLKQARLREELADLTDAELLSRIRRALLGGNHYREKQKEAIELLIQGCNTLAVFGTGRGKSAVFQSVAAYKALRERTLTIILYPLRALVNDQFENMSSRLAGLGLNVYKGNGSISETERAALFSAPEKEEADILLTTPEFVSHHLGKFQQMTRRVGLFVVDESHHIGLASQVHRPIYKRLGELAGKLGHPTVLAVTATAGDEVAAEIVEVLGIDRVVIDPHIRSNLELVDKRDWPDKQGYLKQLAATGEKTIIYVNSRLQTIELAAMLRESLPDSRDRIVFYHAGLTGEQRNTVERMFHRGEVNVVVSTSAFGEGIDIPDVKNVVVFHLNFNFTEFNQQCGRAGRDGNRALIHLLCGKRDAGINRFILESSSPDRDTLAKLYIVIKDLSGQGTPVTSTNDELAGLLKKAGIRQAKAGMVSAGLGILEELGLIEREIIGRSRSVYLLPAPAEKVDIESSLRFCEGQEERAAFQEFQAFFFDAAGEELLSLVNRPILPVRYVEENVLPQLERKL